MHIWLINEGEALPSDETKDRLRRMGLLAEQFNDKGHRVTWFNSTFYHARKIQRSNKDAMINVSLNYDIQLIWSNSYKRNVSLARIKHHSYTAKRFLELAKGIDKPDIILCSMPTIELAEAAVIYAKKNNIPVVVDIRDLWPDIFVEMVPRSIRNIIMPYILYSRKRLGGLLRKADAIIALTDSFLEWGLNYAGRGKSHIDRVFNMAYKIDENISKDCFDDWKQYGIKKDDFIISFFGTLGKQFIFEPILDAAKELVYKKKIKFVICGDGESMSSIKEKTISLNNIIFTGWVNQKKILSLLKITSIGLAPYRESKNFTMNVPNKFGEYLSAGIPIMLGIDGEMSELTSKYNCGYVYNDGKDLAQYIFKLIENKGLLKIMGDNAIKLYKERFDANKVYSEMAAHLELISQNKIKE